MVLKTRKALPKFRLFRKFKIDFFDFASKATRVSRKYLYFYIGRRNRYAFWCAKQVRYYAFYRYLQYRGVELFYRKFPRVLRRFTLFQAKARYQSRFIIKNFVSSVVISNNIRVFLSQKLLRGPIQGVNSFITPLRSRVEDLYDLKTI